MISRVQPATPRRLGAYAGYVLFLLVLVNVLNTMDRVIVSVLMIPIKTELGLSDTQVGLLAGFAFALFYAALGIPLGRMADRRARVPLLALCLGAWSLMTVFCGLARTGWQMMLARVGVGIGEAGCVPAALSLIADYFPGGRRVIAISVFQAGSLLGSMAGLMLGGFLADTIGWRSAFLAFGAPGVALAVVFWLTVREPARSSIAQPEDDLPLLPSLWRLLRGSAFRHLLVALSFGSFAGHGMGLWLPTYFVRTFGLSLSEIGLWSGLASGIGGVGGVIGGGFLASALIRRDPRWELWFPALCYLAATPLYWAMLSASSAPVAFAFQFGAILAVTASMGAGISAVQSAAPAALRSMAIALVLFSASIIGYGAAPFGIGLVSDLLSQAAGRDMLRISLAFGTLAFFLPVFHFVAAARCPEFLQPKLA